MSFPPPALKDLAVQVVTLLIERKETVSFAETATGGLVAATILSLPGTSQVFVGGVNSYSLRARQAFLGWTEADSASYQGPTEEIVVKLATNLRSHLQSTWTVSESGVAGPSRPDVYRAEIEGPGFCPIAVVGPDGFVLSRTVQIEGQPRERAENMVSFAQEMLQMLLDVLKDQSSKL